MSRAPFVTLNAESGLFEISDQARRLLSEINAPLVVFALVGPYRTGKSSLLNTLLRLFGLLNRGGADANGFAVGETTQACTRGIHMFTRPAVTADGLPVLFVDTEGLNSTDRGAGANHDIQIFLLAALIASCLAYNSKGTIDERAVADLSIVGEMARMLAPDVASAGGGGAKRARSDADDVADFMPELLWIVRDFSLRLVSAAGAPYTAQQYMEEALAPRASSSASSSASASDDANETRRVISTMFPHRTCITIRVPSAEEERVQQLNATPVTDLRIEFIQDVHQVLQHVKTRARPKSVVDPLTGARAPLTGPAFLQYLETAVAAVNQGAAPPLKSSYALLSETQCASAAAAARNLVAAAIKNGARCGSSSSSPDELLAAAMALFAQRSFGSHADAVRPQLEEELRAQIADAFGAALRRAVDAWVASSSASATSASDIDLAGDWRRSVAPLAPPHLAPLFDSVVSVFCARDSQLRERAEEESRRAQSVRPQLDEARRRLNEEATARRELQEALASKTLDLETAERALERDRARGARTEADLKELRDEATRANAAAANAITLRGELDDKTAALERASRALAQQDRDVAALQSDAQQTKDRLTVAESEIARLRGAEERARRTELALSSARAELEDARATCAAEQARAQKAEEDGDRARVDAARARRERDEALASHELSRVATESQSLAVQLEARQEEMRHMRARLDNITRRCRELEESKFELERALRSGGSLRTSAQSRDSVRV